MRTGMPAHLCQERSPCAVRAPPVRTRAGRPRTRRKPQVRAFAGGGFWGAPACLRGARASGAHAGGTPAHPAQPSGARPCRSRLVGKPWRAIFRFRQQDAQTPLPPCVGARGWRNLTGGDFWGSPGVPSFVSGSRTPRLPILPFWEKGAGGMRGHTRTGMPAHLCQERSPCAVRAPPARMGAGRPRTRRNPQVRALAGAGWLASPGVPSFVSGSRTPRLPLLPVWEQGARGMRGQTHTGMQKITHRSQELYP